MELKKVYKRQAKKNQCNYYQIVLPSNATYRTNSLARKSRCIVKNNQLYIKRVGMPNAFVKVLIPGYFSLTACSPQPSNGGSMGLIGYAATASYRNYHKVPYSIWA